MSIVQTCGWEAKDTSAEGYSPTGTISVSTAQKKTGDASLRVQGTGVNGTVHRTQHRALGTNGAESTSLEITNTYCSFYIMIATAPSGANGEYICAFMRVSSLKFAVRVTSERKLRAYDTSETQIGSDGATVLSLNTWYRIDASCGVTSSAGATDGPFEVKIDGITELSGTANILNTACTHFHMGITVTRSASSYDIYFDDLVIDNATFQPTGHGIVRLDLESSAQEEWAPSDALGPNYLLTDDWASGAYDGDTTYIESGTSSVTDIFDMESASAAGISGSVDILAAKVVSIAKDMVGTSRLNVFLRSNGTNAATSNLDPGVSYVSVAKISLLDFGNGNVPWLVSAIDALQCGCTGGAAGHAALRLSVISAMVLFAPVAEEEMFTPHAGI